MQKQAVNMDLQCTLCIANSSYAVKTPKGEVTCDTYWSFYKKWKIWICIPQNGRFRDQTGGRETTFQNHYITFQVSCSKREGWNIWACSCLKVFLQYSKLLHFHVIPAVCLLMVRLSFYFKVNELHLRTLL